MVSLQEIGEASALTSSLSDDSLQLVLGSLPSKFLLTAAALVCRRWHRLSKFCVKALQFSSTPYAKSLFFPKVFRHGQKVLEIAFKYSSSLESLELIGLARIKGSQLQQLLPELSRLRKLGIISCSNLTSEDLLSVISLLPIGLEYIDLHDDHFSDPQCNECLSKSLLQDQHILRLAERCPNLSHVNLDTCSNYSSAALQTLLSSCGSIVTLSIHCHSVGWAEVANIFKSCALLERLSIVSPLLGEAELEEDLMEEHSSRFRPRQRQSLFSHSTASVASSSSSSSSSGSNRTTSSQKRVLQELSSGACCFPPSFHSLKLFVTPHKSISWESDSFAPFLRTVGPQLKALIAHGCFNAAWQRISVLCPNLTCLDLTHGHLTCNLLEVEEVVLVGGLRMLPNLTKLALPSATEKILRTLGLHCTKLQEFRLQSHGPVVLASGNSRCSREGIKDAGIRFLAEGCLNLRTLVLSNCPKISVASVRAITFHCKEIRDLQLAGCSSLGDEMFEILKPLLCRHLQVLNVEGCNITDAFMSSLLDLSKKTHLNLKVLSVKRCFVANKSMTEALRMNVSDLIISCSRSTRTTYSAIPWDGFDFTDWITP